MSQSPLDSNMLRPRGQGWAAFDRKQRAKQHTGTECNVDPFPSISKMAPLGAPKSLINNNGAPIRSFSSIIPPSVGFPLVQGNCNSHIENDKSGTKHHIDQITKESYATPVKMLKDIHMWADQTLIEDVLVAVNNDVDQASVLLKAMISSESKLEDSSLSGPSSSTESCPCKGKNKCLEENNFVENKLPDGENELSASRSLFSLPLEPEWEEEMFT